MSPADRAADGPPPDRRDRGVPDGLPSRVRAAWDRYYPLVAGAAVLWGVLAMGRPFLSRHGTGPPLPHNDTVILEYVGWFLARGNTLYVDVWEIKPPLAFLPPYILAHVTGTDMYAHHLAGMATTALCLAAVAAAVASVVGRATGSPLSGASTALVFASVPGLLYVPWLGYKAKALVAALGAVALARGVAGRHGESGLAAGLAVGVWQLGVVFPAVTAALAWTTGGREALRRHAAGWAIAAGVTVAFLLLVGDVGGFLGQVVLGPLVLRTDTAGFDPTNLPLPTTASVWLVAAGAAGLALSAADPPGEGRTAVTRPLALGGLLAAGALLVDYDGLWDGLVPVLFAAVGVGLLLARLSTRRRVLAAVLLLAAVVPAFAPSEFVRHEPVETAPSDGLPPALDAERETVYWEAREIRSCRFFGARTQRSLLPYVPSAETLAAAPCGDPGVYWRALRERFPSTG